MFLVQKTDFVSAILFNICGSSVAIPAVPAAAYLLLSRVLDIQVSDTLGLDDFIDKVFLGCGFLFDLLF